MKRKVIILIALCYICLLTPVAWAQWQASGTDIYYNSGNVGIGTTITRNGVLTINGSSTVNLLRLENDGQGLESTLRFRSKNLSGAYLHADISEDAEDQLIGIKIPYNNNVGEGYRMVIKSNGNIGIGTISPSSNLDVYSSDNNSASGLVISQGNGNGNRNSGRLFFENKGELDNSFVIMKVGDVLSFRTNAKSNTTSGTERMTINKNGNVGINTANATEKLTVNGNIKAKELTITANVGADYVFDKGYHLIPLSNIKRYIKTHKHLPGIASASEMKKDGVKVGELQIKLLKKVEELTDYVIQLKEENSQMEKQIKQLRSNEKK